MAEIEIKELSGLLEMVGEEAHGELVRTTEAMSTAQLKKITFKKRMMEYLLDL
jgi:hypothetical protein